MVGLAQYVKKYGNHFTIPLAKEAVKYLRCTDGSSPKCDVKYIEEAIQKRVYYNITNSTLGDIVYMVYVAYSNLPSEMPRKRKISIDNALALIESTDSYEGMAFSSWIAGMDFKEEDFDFNAYI